MPFPGVTPLFFAIYGPRSTAITRLLLDHDADPNKAAYDRATPLLVAICEGYHTVACMYFGTI
jgi:ankyrin repeat protein